MPDLRYPLGPFVPPATYTAESRAAALDALAALPMSLRLAIGGLDDAQLDTPYRPGGWSVRQLVHHVADSHANAFIRVKLALTEEVPTIKPYDEERWAELADARETPIAVSLAMLVAVHDRLLRVLRAMSPADFGRELIHPVSGRQTIDRVVALYAWHGAHHVAHVTALRAREGWR